MCVCVCVYTYIYTYIDIKSHYMFDYQPYFVGQETRAMKAQVPGHANATQPSCVDSSFTVEMHRTSPVSLLLCLFSWSSYSHPFLSSPERLDGSGRLILDLCLNFLKVPLNMRWSSD